MANQVLMGKTMTILVNCMANHRHFLLNAIDIDPTFHFNLSKKKMSDLATFTNGSDFLSCAPGTFSALYSSELKVDDWAPSYFSEGVKKGLAQLAKDLRGLEMHGALEEQFGGLPGGLKGRLGFRLTKTRLRTKIFYDDNKFERLMRKVHQEIRDHNEATLLAYWNVMIHCAIQCAHAKLTATLRVEQPEAEEWMHEAKRAEVLGRFYELLGENETRDLLHKWVPIVPVYRKKTERWYFCLNGITNYLWHKFDDLSKEEGRGYAFTDSVSAVMRTGMCGLLNEILERNGRDNRYGWWVVDCVYKKDGKNVSVGYKVTEKPRKLGYIDWDRV